MTAYTPQLAMNFWFDYDNHFLWEAPPEIQQQVGTLFTGGETLTYLQFQNAIETNQFPEVFITAVKPHQDVLAALFNEQDQMLQKYFGDSTLNQQRAFEDFGQGTLYDPRREKEDPYQFWPIHSMDADYAAGQPPIGYYTWYSFLRAFTILNNITDGKWLMLATHIALAAAIQEYMKPQKIEGGVHANPNNPPISQEQLEAFRNKYLPMDFAALDEAFTSDDTLGPRPRKLKFPRA